MARDHGRVDWRFRVDGSIPFEDLPHTFDPPEHFMSPPTTGRWPPTIRTSSLEYPEPFRAQRITDLIASETLHGERFTKIADTLSLHAQTLRRCSCGVTRRCAHSAGGGRLGQWNSPPATPQQRFQAWSGIWRPRSSATNRSQVLPYAGGFVHHALCGQHRDRRIESVVRQRNTPQKETCDQAVTQALEDGLICRRGWAAISVGGDGTRSTTPCFLIRVWTRSVSFARSSVDRSPTAATGAPWTWDPLRRHHPTIRRPCLVIGKLSTFRRQTTAGSSTPSARAAISSRPTTTIF